MSAMTEEWLRKTDHALSQERVPVKQRPWDAWGRWSEQTGPSRMDSPEATAIMDWYKDSYGAEAFAVGCLFRGAFYFDAEVWAMIVPICFGTVSINVTDMVDNMPPVVAERLNQDRIAVNNLVALGADCLDYGLGFDDLKSSPLSCMLGKDLLVSADRKLRSSVSLLLSGRSSQGAAEAARMATEMYLKCYLAHHTGATEVFLKKEVWHDLDKALSHCLAHDPSSDLSVLAGQFDCTSSIEGRYGSGELTLLELWRAYALAQSTGASVVRSISGRDVRPTLATSWKPPRA